MGYHRNTGARPEISLLSLGVFYLSFLDRLGMTSTWWLICSPICWRPAFCFIGLEMSKQE
jgi:hypothetical protein